MKPVLIACAATLLLACGKTDPKPQDATPDPTPVDSTANAQEGPLEGAWVWLGDVDGAEPEAGTTVLMRFSGAELVLYDDAAADPQGYLGTFAVSGCTVSLTLPGVATVTAGYEGGAGGCGAAKAAVRPVVASVRPDNIDVKFPFSLRDADHVGASLWKKVLEADITIKVEAGPCRQLTWPGGAADLKCHAGLAGGSTGNRCLNTVTRYGRAVVARELGCVVDCKNSALEPDPGWDCVDQPGYASLEGKTVYRNLKALSPLLQDQIADDRDTAYSWMGNLRKNGKPVTWEAAHAAEERIVEAIKGGMIWHATQITPVDLYEQVIDPDFALAVSEDGTHAAEAGVDWDARKLYLCQKVFHEPYPDGVLHGHRPELVAATLMHEYHHIRQGVPPAENRDAKLALREVWTRAELLGHPFFRWVLTAPEREAELQGLVDAIKGFDAEWKLLGAPGQKEVACWAWTFPWMRSQMVFYPQGESGLWGRLAAVFWGRGDCPG